MRISVFLTALGLAAALAAPAVSHAGGAVLPKMVEATKKDFESVKQTFKKHILYRRKGDAGKRSLAGVQERIAERRRALSRMLRDLPAGSGNGLFRMLARELDRANVSILALIRDERGYAGYLRTGDQSLLPVIMNWHEGIRQMLDQTGRAVTLARRAAGPMMAGPVRP